MSIDFTYTSLRFPKRPHNFRWYWKREKQKEGQVSRDTLDVYLMSKDRDGNLDYKQRNPQLHEYEGTDREKYYCSNVPPDCSQENFYEILDSLIEERNHK